MGLTLRRHGAAVAVATFFASNAAAQNNARAQTLLGGMYYLGQGVEVDLVEAVRWITLAADQGYAEAEVMLGLHFRTLKDPGPNYVEAFRRYKSAAEKGNRVAELELAKMYQSGQGTAEDHRAAAYWYKRAADHGNEAAILALGVAYENARGVEKKCTRLHPGKFCRADHAGRRGREFPDQAGAERRSRALVDEHPHPFGELAVAVGQQEHVFGFLVTRPLFHHERIVDRNADDRINAVRLERGS